MEQEKVTIVSVYYKDDEGINRVTSTWAVTMESIESFTHMYKDCAHRMEIKKAVVWRKDDEDSHQGKRHVYIVSGKASGSQSYRKCFNCFDSIFEWVEDMQVEAFDIRKAVIM